VALRFKRHCPSSDGLSLRVLLGFPLAPLKPPNIRPPAYHWHMALADLSAPTPLILTGSLFGAVGCHVISRLAREFGNRLEA